ncbi:protein FAM111A-like [Sinocyclocheilus grahami]|uniref:protein FAM111A-like n=1 Tax=Sinocyclocheilus grahami TaxID=75366 RepID=UPI0007AC7348|nr:PREDICTED: protein FAM111A-like [Sinocyclocheilus grahami]
MHDTSKTVLEALMKNNIFMNIKKNKEKEIVILRSKGNVLRAAVKTDFPCCLIEKDEILKIQFINNDGNASTEQKPTTDYTSNPETLVTFYIHTTGGEKIKLLMKNRILRLNVDDVCVYAFKEEDCITALKRDGRFIDYIFQKHCALSEMDSETIYEMSITAEHLHQKHFRVVVLSDQNQPDSQDDLTFVKTEPNVASDADVAETAGSSQNPINTEQDKKQDGNTTSMDPSTKQYVAKPNVNSEEILGILRDQFPDLLETLKKREKLKNKSEVQKFFREEYGKSVENFLEVKKVKQLMKLSDSVCQIRKGGTREGTGFLLFNRFILTNAHVIGIFTDLTKVNAEQFTAVFGYEDLDSKDSKCIPVKQLTDYFYGKDDKGRHLDYALLELDVDKMAECPNLFDSYSPNAPIKKGQICIVGHPGEGVKKMDPCFIIERENRLEAAHKHASEHQHLIHVINEKCVEEKWDFSAYENQFTYDSCFFHGSSGSPVFDVDCNLIGIHTGGYKYKTKGDKTWSVMEYGFSMQPILDNIIAVARIKGLLDIIRNVSQTAEQQNLIDTEMKDAEEPEES